MEKNALEGGPTKGRMATCYLGRQYRQALDTVCEEKGWLHSHYVKIALLEKMVRDGVITQSVVEVEIQKVDFRKEHPHGNSKRAKERRVAGASTNKEQEVEDPSSARARSRTGKLSPAQRRIRRLARSNAT